MGRTARRAKPKFKQERQEKINTAPLKALNKKQQTYMELLEDKTVIVATGYAGTSKAQPLYAKVHTPKGFVAMGDILPGDVVTTPTGTATVLDTFLHEDKAVFEITLKSGRKVRACGDHLWKTRGRLKGKGGGVDDLDGVFTTDFIRERLSTHNFSLPLSGACEIEQGEKLGLPPYTMGVLLSEGHLGNSCTFTTADIDVAIRVNSELCGYGVHVSKIESSKCSYILKMDAFEPGNQFTGINNPAVKEIHKLGLNGKLSDDKFIPRCYIDQPVVNRRLLLQGLMDGDGSASMKRKNGATTSYSTVSKQLAKDVAELAHSLGYVTTTKKRKTISTYKGWKLHGQDVYVVSISGHNQKDLFFLDRKRDRCSDVYQNGKYEPMDRIVSIDYVEHDDVKCILLDDEDHLYITDEYVVTHNTYIPTVSACDLYRMEQINHIIFCRPAVSNSKSLGFFAGTLVEKMQVWLSPVLSILRNRIGEGALEIALKHGDIIYQPLETIKGCSFEDAWIIVDEAEDLTWDEIKKIITRIGRNSKLILAGDITQSELRENSGLSQLIEFSQRQRLGDEFGFIDFNDPNDIVRSDAVKNFIVALNRDSK